MMEGEKEVPGPSQEQERSGLKMLVVGVGEALESLALDQ